MTNKHCGIIFLFISLIFIIPSFAFADEDKRLENKVKDATYYNIISPLQAVKDKVDNVHR